MHNFMLRSLGTDHATFISNAVISNFFFLFGERTAVLGSGMNEMSVHIGIKLKAQHNKKANQK